MFLLVQLFYGMEIVVMYLLDGLFVMEEVELQIYQENLLFVLVHHKTHIVKEVLEDKIFQP